MTQPFTNMTEDGYLAYCAAWVITQDSTYRPIECDVDSASRAHRAGIVFG